jgi:hypothetical protein
MEDNLAVINRIIEWHRTIREHAKLVGDSITDHEALVSLAEARSDWIPGRLEGLSEKQEKLQRTLRYLDEGLKNHFSVEEDILPPLLGELFTRALVLEHREMSAAMSEAKSIVADIRLEGLGREELLSKELHMKRVTDNICQLVEEHATREEVVLEMLQRALEDMRQNRGQ